MSANSKVLLQASRLNLSGLRPKPDITENTILNAGFQMPHTVDRNRPDVFEMALGISCNFLEEP
jgi:hypothetical protein